VVINYLTCRATDGHSLTSPTAQSKANASADDRSGQRNIESSDVRSGRQVDRMAT
jgi:hypothetical protein